MSTPCNVVVLISGSGSNLQALIDSLADAPSSAVIRAVVSNRADAFGLERARKAGIETCVLDHKAYADRESFDAALVQAGQGKDVFRVSHENVLKSASVPTGNARLASPPAWQAG